MRPSLLLAVAFCGLLRTPVAEAQFRPPPSAAECAAWAQDLAAGGARALNAVTTGWPAGCPDGGPALGAALVAARGQRDAEYLWQLARSASEMRDPAIAISALQIARDPSATTPARAAAVLVAISQLGSGWEFPGRSGRSLLTDSLPATGLCRPVASSIYFAIDNPLPDGYDRQVAQILDPIASQGGNPSLLRNLARCSRQSVALDVLPQIDVSRVRLEYVCGNVFRVYNPTGERLRFVLREVGSDEVTEMPVDPGERRTYIADGTGAVTLLYDDRVLQTMSNGGRSCR